MTVSHIPGGPAYRSIAEVAIAEGGSVLARNRRGEVRRLTSGQFRLLQQLSDFRTAEQLRQHLTQAPDDLSWLETAGLIESDKQVLEGCAALAGTLPGDETLPPIADLGILTCGKPHLLQRSVQSWVAFARHHHRDLRITVVDDSPTQEGANAQRQAAKALEVEVGAPLRFVDPSARSALGRELARLAGVEPELGEFAVSGRAQPRVGIGGSRNLLHLIAPARRLLSADEDVIARFTPPGRHDLALWITTENLPVHTYFFDSVAETEAQVAVSPDPDALALHEAFVGHAVHSVVARLNGPASIEGAAPALTASLQGGSMRIAATALGLAGDCASDCLGFFSLLVGGDTAQRVLARKTPLSPSREVLRRPEFPILCQGVDFMTFCHAVDNTLPLPPYFPVGRGEDQVWQKLLHWSLPDTVVAHLPLAVRHRPDGERRYLPKDYLDPCAVFPGNAFMLGLLGTAPPVGPEQGPDARLAVLGRHLADVAGNPASFSAVVSAAWRAYLAHHQALVSTALSTRPRYPTWWQNSMRKILETIRKRQGNVAAVPLEYASLVGPSAIETLRGDVCRFARLLAAWPRLRQASEGLAQRAGEDPAWLRP